MAAFLLLLVVPIIVVSFLTKKSNLSRLFVDGVALIVSSAFLFGLSFFWDEPIVALRYGILPVKYPGGLSKMASLGMACIGVLLVLLDFVISKVKNKKSE